MTGGNHVDPSLRGHVTRSRQHTLDWPLLGVGIMLILLPVILAICAPVAFDKTEFFLRVIAALGGGLIGAFIPGALQVTLPGMKGAGALGVFALIFSVNPPHLAGNIAQQQRVDSAKSELQAQRGQESMTTLPAREAIVQKIQAITPEEALRLAKVMEPQLAQRPAIVQQFVHA